MSTQNSLNRRFLEKKNYWLNSRYFVLVKWLVLSSMLYLVYRFINLTDLVSSFERISLSTLIGFLGLVLLSKFFYTFRWYLICVNGFKLSNTSSVFLLRINLLAEFVGIAMPSSLGGEAVRLLKLNARTGMLARAITSIVADRLIGVASMVLITLVLLPTLNGFITWRLPLPMSNFLAIFAWGIVSFSTATFCLCWRNRWVQLSKVSQQLKLNFLLLLISILLSVGGHLVFAGAHYLLFQDIQPFPFLVIVTLILASQLVRSIPISLLGIGLSEGSMVALSGLVGITPEVALVAVVVALLSRYIFAVCGLLIELLYDGKILFHAMATGRNSEAEGLKNRFESVDRI